MLVLLLVGLALAATPTGALAQGNVWYVVTHSGTNILSFDTSGQPIVAPGETTPWPVLTGATLHDPRGFVVTPGGDLYLANAFKNDSRILHFGPAAGATGTLLSRPCLGVFTQSTDSTQPNYSQGLQHPFNLVFGSDGNVYVANQGDPASNNSITRYYGPGCTHAGCTPGAPMPALVTGVPGTFIPPYSSANPDGVQVVRDLVFGPDGHLYVTDEAARAVRMYHGHTGAFITDVVTHKDGLDTPVHLLVSGDVLYIGSSKKERVGKKKKIDVGKIMRYQFSSGAIDTVVAHGAGGLGAPSGMALDGDWLYVGSRTTQQILRFALDTGAPDADNPFIGLDDDPEFITLLQIPDGPAATPGPCTD